MKNLKKKLSKDERYQIALVQHIKYMRSLGLKVDDNGRIIKQYTRKTPMILGDSNKSSMKTTELSKVETKIPSMGNGGTKQDNSWKIEISKQYTIVPAYNKGPYMVVPRSDLKTAGRKV